MLNGELFITSIDSFELYFKKTERALGNTVMFVYYDDVGVNRVCFEITAHRKFMIANQQPSYVAAYKIHDDDGKITWKNNKTETKNIYLIHAFSQMA